MPYLLDTARNSSHEAQSMTAPRRLFIAAPVMGSGPRSKAPLREESDYDHHKRRDVYRREQAPEQIVV